MKVEVVCNSSLGSRMVSTIIVSVLLSLAILCVNGVFLEPSQVETLLIIKKDLDPDGRNLSSWNTQNPCENWIGLTCTNSGLVSRIILTDTITTIAPNETLEATLERDLGGNFVNFPTTFFGLTALEHLVIANSNVVGTIPDNIVNLTKLKTMNFSLNHISGVIPADIGNLQELQILDLELNNGVINDPSGFGAQTVGGMNGSVPTSLENLSNLLILNLHSNAFTGNFPSLQKMTNLQSLTLSQNGFTGNISTIFGFHPQLWNIDISYNAFYGEIPDIIGNYSSLTQLSFNENHLSGSIPESFCNLGNLQYMDVSTNFLTSLPSSLGRLQSLSSLNLRNNLFTGELPSSLTMLTNLQHVELYRNGFTGKFPDLSNSSQLTYLDISYNFFSDSNLEIFLKLPQIAFLFVDFSIINASIPESFSELRNLVSFSCRHCSLIGNIPVSIGNWTTLSFLDLSENKLTGTIPRSFGNFVNISSLLLHANHLSGSLPNELSACSQLTDLTLNNNQFSGSIPKWMGNFPSLGRLFMQSNSFSGIIPPEMGKLPVLQFLDLSSNLLVGPVPASFGNMIILSSLILSNNQLSGALPREIGNLNFLVTLEIRNTSLEGTLPIELKNLYQLQTLDVSINMISGSLPNDFFSNFTAITLLKISSTSIFGAIPDISNLALLEKLDLSYNRFSGSIPATIPASLIYLDVSSNDLTGNVPNLAAYHNLGIFFAQNNELSGNLPNITNVGLVSLANNNLNGSVPSNLPTTNQSINLSGNPVCELTALGGTQVCNSNITQPLRYEAAPVCMDTCFGDNSPNPYLFYKSDECVCSAYATITLSISLATVEVFTAQLATIVGNFLASNFGIANNLVWVTAANTEPSGNVDLSFQLYGTDPSAPSNAVLSHVLYILNPNEISNPGLTIPNVGFAKLTSFYVSQFIAPPPPPPNASSLISTPSGGSSFFTQKGNIAALFGCLLILIAVVVFFSMAAKSHYIKLERQTSFAIQIQKHFVKFIPLQEIKKSTNSFSEDLILGHGGFGTVYKGISPENELWAVKRAKTINLKGLQVFQTEVDIISQMNHNSIVKLLGYCDEHNEQILVYEFMPNGTLKERLKRSNNGEEFFPFGFRLDTAISSAEGLRYLHLFANPTIIHRDVKSENILFDESFTAKVADFGLLKDNFENKSEDGSRTRLVGTPGYWDPEYFQTYQVTTKSDVYSFGVVLFELITGKPALFRNSDVPPGESFYLTNLVHWAFPRQNDLDSLVDPQMGDYSRIAMAMLLQIALMCTEQTSENRPDMDEVCRKLNEVKEELKGIRSSREMLFKSSSSTASRSSRESVDMDALVEHANGFRSGSNSDHSSDFSNNHRTTNIFSQMSTILGGR